MTKKSRILIGVGALALIFVGALCFIPVSVFCTTTTPALYSTSVPVADDTANSSMSHVIGSKSDATASGAVDTTSSIMAYIKQLVTGQIAIDAFFDVPTADVATNATVRDVVGNKTDAAVGTGTTDKSLMGYTKGILEDTGTTIPALHAIPSANATTNTNARDVIGNKTDTAVGTATTDKSLMGYLKGVLEDTGTTIPALVAVPDADVATNANVRDVVGNKTDAAVGAATTDKSLMGYLKGVLEDTGTTIPATIVTLDALHDVPTADVATNAQMRDVIGNKTDAAATSTVSGTESLMAYAKQNVTNTEAILADTAVMQPVQEMAVSKTLTTIASGVNGLFTVAGGPIKILEIVGYVATEIEAKSCLINYNINPTAPATDTVFGTDATALEINADAVGTLYTWDGVVANDLTAVTNGVAIGTAAYSGLIVPPGGIELAAVVATSATGAINFYMRYIPLSTGVTVTAQ